MKKKFPKKAKLISNGFYKIILIDKFNLMIYYPIMKTIKFNVVNFEEDINFSRNLVFKFDRVFGGYAEYKQIDVIK